MKKIVAAKLHGIHVTGADLNYHGSITLDPDHCEAAGIFPMEFVDIWNKQSGARISTYVIFGERGSKCCVLNGAAARTCAVGDQVIICSANYMTSDQIGSIEPKILTFHKDNSIAEMLSYKATKNDRGFYDFAIESEDGEDLPIPLHSNHLQKRAS